MKFEATLLKAGTPDSNGRIYSKEALKKAVEEYNNRKKSPNDGIDHPSRTENLQEIYKHDSVDTLTSSKPYLKSIDFDVMWNDKFDEEVNKKVLELARKLYGKNKK